MAFCAVCGKGPRSGNNVSHANNRTKRVWRPNLQPARIVTENGTHKRVRVCTSCISAGKIRKHLLMVEPGQAGEPALASVTGAASP